MTDDITSRARKILTEIIGEAPWPKWNSPSAVAMYELLVDRIADHLRQVAAESREAALREAVDHVSNRAIAIRAEYLTEVAKTVATNLDFAARGILLLLEPPK